MTLVVEIEDKVRQSLELIAKEKGKPVGQFAGEILDEYIDRRVGASSESFEFTKLSETSFSEWDNDEDAIYDSL